MCGSLLIVTSKYHVLENPSVYRLKVKTRLNCTVEPGKSKLFEKQQKVYYCQEFTIEEVIFVINRLKGSQKQFTIDPLFTIDQFTIARFDCIKQRIQNV